MELTTTLPKPDLPVAVEALTALIAATQRPNGEIPWSPGEKTDPWDHVEAAMGLTIGGEAARARRAYAWLAASQLPDGSWYAAYRDGAPLDRTRDANLSAYVAVGVCHYLLVTGDEAFAARMWPMVRRAVDFALRLQTPEGPIHWAISPEGRVDPMALLTGSSSILMSLKCGRLLAERLGAAPPGWGERQALLVEAIRHRRHLFNMTKSRFAMDWFYPVLAGALTGSEARRRIDKYWKKFVIEGQGVRCVFDQPWVTVAETCELVLALAAMGARDMARLVFGWIGDKRYEDGSFWCGYTYPEMVIWPEDKITWTNAVVLLAADALYHLTPASRLFDHEFWEPPGSDG
jgi:hypothetical protein